MQQILHWVALATLFAAGCAASAVAQPVATGPTLAGVRQRDVLLCGASPNAPGFGAPDSRGEYRGLDPDICRAVAPPRCWATPARRASCR